MPVPNLGTGPSPEGYRHDARPEEVNHVVSRRGSSAGPDPVALIEIDLYGELMIAATGAAEERLSPDRIDEVLRVVRFRRPGPPGDADV